MIKNVCFKNIKFNNFQNKDFKKFFKNIGLFVFPSGPGLASIKINSNYHLALIRANYVFFDSGFFVLFLRLFKGIKVNKFSGYKFLDYFFNESLVIKNKSIFSIDPDKENLKLNKKFLKRKGFKKVFNYLAPNYHTENILDKSLINKLNSIKPNYILINIGGGTQEILGYYLKKKLKLKTSIYCTGGAISYFTGKQAPINRFLDNLYLGWLIRILFNPRLFLYRYLVTFKFLITLLTSKITINQ